MFDFKLGGMGALALVGSGSLYTAIFNAARDGGSRLVAGLIGAGLIYLVIRLR